MAVRCLYRNRFHPAPESNLILTQNVPDSLHAIVYIIGCNPCEWRFANRALKNHLPDITPGRKCHELLWDGSGPCDICPMTDLKADKSRNIEMYPPQIRPAVECGQRFAQNGRQ